MPLPVTTKRLGIQNLFSKSRGVYILASELKSHCEICLGQILFRLEFKSLFRS